MAGCRNEYRDKQHLEIEYQVDSAAENSFANIKDRLSWDFEDEYLVLMDWSNHTDDNLKSGLKKNRNTMSYKTPGY